MRVLVGTYSDSISFDQPVSTKIYSVLFYSVNLSFVHALLYFEGGEISAVHITEHTLLLLYS